MPGLKQRGLELYGWFEQRLGLGTPIIEMAEHEVPENTSSWWYVFGSAATVLLVLQVMTGVLLALVYDFCQPRLEQPPVPRSQCEAWVVSARRARLGF